MATTYATFIVSFPELSDAGQPLIEAKIADAETRVGTDGIWVNTATRDIGVAYRAAHLLALSPYGKQAKLVSKNGETTYGEHYKQLIQELGVGFLVL